jgi:hypothetical protein
VTDLPNAITGTSLWRRTLARQDGSDSDEDKREHLRDTFRQFRSRAEILAQDISSNLPDFSLHDITGHIDPLWQVADELCGEDYPFAPTEAFVLGGAFLLHDLGLALASYQEGISGLKKTGDWQIAAVSILRQRLGRTPQQHELETLDRGVEQEVVQTTLRARHARQAENLGVVEFGRPHLAEKFYLIQDDDLRRLYGPLIGKIAYSHWWPVTKLCEELGTRIGGPPGSPKWDIDPLKLACILRAADACHLDEKRVPAFLRAIRQPRGTSAIHWDFQQYLQCPKVTNSRIAFTSSRPFPPEHAEAWWLCHDTLQRVDDELRCVDSLLRDEGREPLTASGVAGIDSPVQLSKYVKVQGWSPVDARVRITDAVSLIQRLGGEGLYGHNLFVPLRELIQNAADAVRARRIEESRDGTDGKITVSIGGDKKGDWIEVADSGIGMSEEVLTGPLLDFGVTYWTSQLMAKEHPKLAASNFDSIGRFGIGFFSVFMWGRRVRVVTRRQDDGIADTRVLEFGDQGLQARPILRLGRTDEQRTGPGTSVRVWLKQRPSCYPCGWQWLLGRLAQFGPYRGLSTIDSLRAVCAWLCPTLDVDVDVKAYDQPPQPAIAANDWMTMDDYDLLVRVTPLIEEYYERWTPESLRDVAPNLRSIVNSDGTVVGRACVGPVGGGFGVVTAGGFRANPTTVVMGVFVGTPTTIARQWARPVVEQQALASWATEQADLVQRFPTPRNMPTHFAELLRSVGADTRQLPIALGEEGFLNRDQIKVKFATEREMILVDKIVWSQYLKERQGLRLLRNVVVASCLSVNNARELWPWRPQENAFPNWPHLQRNTLGGAVVEAVCEGWEAEVTSVLKCSEFLGNQNDRNMQIAVHASGPFEGKVLATLRRPE